MKSEIETALQARFTELVNTLKEKSAIPVDYVSLGINLSTGKHDYRIKLKVHSNAYIDGPIAGSDSQNTLEDAFEFALKQIETGEKAQAQLEKCRLEKLQRDAAELGYDLVAPKGGLS